MTAIWRILGFHAVAELGRRLPPRQARLITLALLVVANLLPIVGVLFDWMTVADVFLAYWLETVIIGVLAVVRICTAAGEPRDTRRTRLTALAMFVPMYGVLTALHGAILMYLFSAAAMFAESLSAAFGWGDPADFAFSAGHGWIYVAAGLLVSHLVTLTMYWFGRGERLLHGAESMMWRPFGRVLVIQLVVSIDVFLLIGLLVLHEVILVVILVAVKLAVDVATHLLGRFKVL